MVVSIVYCVKCGQGFFVKNLSNNVEFKCVNEECHCKMKVVLKEAELQIREVKL